MPDSAADQDHPAAAPSAAVRAQLLATEHWSLLASRSTTQSEVLSRISMLLNLVSAALVSLALVGQATQFSDTFVIFAIAVLAIVSLTGLLTQVRVMHVGNEDLMYVLAMNRLRAAYVELDPGIDRSLMASRFDDRAGLAQTYFFLQPKRGAIQFFGSSMMFTIAVNSTLCGLLAAAITGVSGAGTPSLITVGVLVCLGFAAWSTWWGGRRFRAVWRDYVPLHPSPTIGGRPARLPEEQESAQP